MDRFTNILNQNSHKDSMFITVVIGVTLAAFILYKWYSYRAKKQVKNLEEKAVLITGCDSGFGRELARQLDALGCTVFAGCFTEKGAKSLKDETSEKLQTIHLDVTSTESIKAAYNFIESSLNKQPDVKLWGIVNNAGIGGVGGPFEFHHLQDFREIMEVNVLGPVNVILTFLPFIKLSRGRIVNVSSLAGLVSSRIIPISYAMSKFAMVGFTESLRLEQKIWGVKVAGICPGFYKTNIVDQEMLLEKGKAVWERASPDTKKEFGENYIEKYVKNFIKTVNSMASSDLTEVTDSIQHALFAEHPHNMYICGRVAKILYLLSRVPFLPMEKLGIK